MAHRILVLVWGTKINLRVRGVDPYLYKKQKELAQVENVKETFEIFGSLGFDLDQLDDEEPKLSYRTHNQKYLVCNLIFSKPISNDKVRDAESNQINDDHPVEEEAGLLELGAYDHLDGA